MRRTVPLLFAFVVGVILLSQYFNPALFDFYEIALQWSPIIAGVTAFLGIFSFCMHHWNKTKKRAKDWRFSVMALAAFCLMVVAGIWGATFGFDPPDVPPTWGEGDERDWVSFEDLPDDAGGRLDIRWRIENRVGAIRGFEVLRRAADEGENAYVKIAGFEGTEHEIGKLETNREELGKRLPSMLENGGFDAEFTAWTVQDGATIDENEYRGNYAVLPDGASLLSPAFTLRSSRRLRLSAITRATTAEVSLATTVLVEGLSEPLRTYESAAQRKILGAPAFGDWTDAVPGGLENDILTPEGTEEITFRIRFTARGGEMWLDDVALRPVQVEFQLEFHDAAPFNNNRNYPQYGEGKCLLSVHSKNPSFDGSLDMWTFDPPAPSPEAKSERHVKRLDKEKKHCVELPAGTSLLSARLPRATDPMGHRLSYRLRGWGKGGDSGLMAEILAFTPEEEILGTTKWPAGSGWEVKELLVEVPDETTELQLRYTATGDSGSARVDDMLFMPVKTAPVAEKDYVYKVVALGEGGAVLGAVESKPIAGEFETIASWKSYHGLYRWLFNYMLVPMEATMFALLAFYIASAAFRAFRARSFEATLLLVAAIFVMIGRVPLGELIWRPLGDFADWIMEYPNGASKRAIMIGVGLGMCATSLKLMLGIERTYLGKG